MARSKRAVWLRLLVAALAAIQGCFIALRAWNIIDIGTDIATHGLLLPAIGSLVTIWGIVVVAISVLFVVFACGAVLHKDWALPVGFGAAAINLFLVGLIILKGDAAPGTWLWGIVPLIVLGYVVAEMSM